MTITSSPSYFESATVSIFDRLNRIETDFAKKKEVLDPESSKGRSVRKALSKEISDLDSEIVQLVSSTRLFSEGDLNRCMDLREKLFSLNIDIQILDSGIESQNTKIPTPSFWQRLFSWIVPYPKTEDVIPTFRFRDFCTALQQQREKCIQNELTSQNLLVSSDDEMKKKIEVLGKTLPYGSSAIVAKLGEHVIDLQIVSKPDKEPILRKFSVRITDVGYEPVDKIGNWAAYTTFNELLGKCGVKLPTQEESLRILKPYHEFAGSPTTLSIAKEHLRRVIDSEISDKGLFCLVKKSKESFDLLLRPEDDLGEIREYTLEISPRGQFIVAGEVFQNFEEVRYKLGLSPKTATEALRALSQSVINNLLFSSERLNQDKVSELLKDTPQGSYIIWADDKASYVSGKNLEGQINHYLIDVESDPGRFKLVGASKLEKASASQIEECAKLVGFTLPLQASKRAEVISRLKELVDPSKGQYLESRYNAASQEMKVNTPYYLLTVGDVDIGQVEEFTMHIIEKKRTWLGRDEFKEEALSFKVDLLGQILHGDEVFKNWEAFEAKFLASKEPFLSLNVEFEAEFLHHEELLASIKGLPQYRENARDDLKNYIDLFGEKANGHFAFYMVQSGPLAKEVRVAYIQNGKVLTSELNTAALDVIAQLKATSLNELPKALLVQAKLPAVNPAIDTKALAKEYLDVTTKQSEIEQKALTIYKDKAVAMKNMLSVIDVLGNTSAEGAYALIRDAGSGQYTALLRKDGKIQTYTLDLLSKPGKIVVLPGNRVFGTMKDLTTLGFKKSVDEYRPDLKTVENKFAELMQADAFESEVRSVEDMDQFIRHAALFEGQTKAVWCVRKKENAKTQEGWGVGPWLKSWWASRAEAKPTLALPEEGYCISVINNEGNGRFRVIDYDIALDLASGQFKVQNKLYSSLQESAINLPEAPTMTTKQLRELYGHVKDVERAIKTQDVSSQCRQDELEALLSKVRDYASKPIYALTILSQSPAAVTRTHSGISQDISLGKQQILLNWLDANGKIKDLQLDVFKHPGEIFIPLPEPSGTRYKSLDDIVKKYCGKDAASLKSCLDGFQIWQKEQQKKTVEAEIPPAEEIAPPRNLPRRAKGRQKR